MDMSIKATIATALIIISLFAGGLWYIFQENKRQQLAYDYLQEYLQTTDQRQKAILESEIRKIISSPPLVQTTSASLDSWEQVLASAEFCDNKAKGLVQLNPGSDYLKNWTECMDERLSE